MLKLYSGLIQLIAHVYFYSTCASSGNSSQNVWFPKLKDRLCIAYVLFYNQRVENAYRYRWRKLLLYSDST